MTLAIFWASMAGSVFVGIVAGFVLPRASYRRGYHAGLSEGLRVANEKLCRLFPLLRDKGVTPVEFYRALTDGDTLQN